MKTPRHFCLLALLIFVTACSSSEPSSQMETSPGGISYLRLNLPKATTVAFQVAWPTPQTFDASFNAATASIGSRLILAGGAEGYERRPTLTRRRTSFWAR
jgi:hypothetical protein